VSRKAWPAEFSRLLTRPVGAYPAPEQRVSAEHFSWPAEISCTRRRFWWGSVRSRCRVRRSSSGRRGGWGGGRARSQRSSRRRVRLDRRDDSPTRRYWPSRNRWQFRHAPGRTGAAAFCSTGLRSEVMSPKCLSLTPLPGGALHAVPDLDHRASTLCRRFGRGACNTSTLLRSRCASPT